MPALFVHQLLAESILKRLPSALQARVKQREDAYFLGAQGGDPFYLYAVVDSGLKRNIGVLMHKNNVYGQFLAWVNTVQETDNPTAFSFALGYVTHYAVDTTFHPYVCYRADRAKENKEGRKRDNQHFRIESDIDCLFVERHLGTTVNRYRYPNPRKGICGKELADAFQRVAAEAWGIKTERKPLMRAVNWFLRLQTFLQDRYFWRRKWVSGLETIFHLRRTPSCMIRRKHPDRTLSNATHSEWYYPEMPTEKRTDDVWMLAEKAIDRAVELIVAFDRAVKNGDVLDREAFGLQFVSGILEKNAEK